MIQQVITTTDHIVSSMLNDTSGREVSFNIGNNSLFAFQNNPQDMARADNRVNIKSGENVQIIIPQQILNNTDTDCIVVKVSINMCIKIMWTLDSLSCIITYSINIFPDTGHFFPCDTEILSDDTGGEREKPS